MSASLTSPVGARSWLSRAWEITSDLLIATALIWALPLLLGVVVAAIQLLQRVL